VLYYTTPERLAKDNYSSLAGSFIGNGVNEVLSIQPLVNTFEGLSLAVLTARGIGAFF
jgi:hypothetical protein